MTTKVEQEQLLPRMGYRRQDVPEPLSPEWYMWRQECEDAANPLPAKEKGCLDFAQKTGGARC